MLADEVFDAMMMDIWPGSAAVVDFGLDDQRHYEALYYPILSGEITKLQLRKVAGKGPAITALVNRSRSNPHKGIKFVTSYDNM